MIVLVGHLPFVGCWILHDVVFFYGPLPSARIFVSLVGYLVSHLPTHFNFSVYPHLYVIVHLSICPDIPFFIYSATLCLSIFYTTHVR